MLHQGRERKDAGTFEWPHGTFARVARRLRPQPTPQAVRLVALGISKSKRISRALETERRRLEQREAVAA